MEIDREFLETLHQGLGEVARARTGQLVERAAAVKRGGGKIAVVTGSGPNIHEGVTTLLAELVRLGLVDGIITSSAVVAHEMAGSLDRVRRVPGAGLGVEEALLPKGGLFEVTILDEQALEKIGEELALDRELIARAQAREGQVIIKAAGNMAYPMGLRTERLAMEVEALAKLKGVSFERVAGLGADPLTMIGAGASCGVPVLVSIPQLVGGGMVGLAVGDSIPLKQRSEGVARILAEADMIIESGIALSQEIHDGPFETYTGHGIWSGWEGLPTFSLAGKTLARIDLDPSLEKVWQIEQAGASVQQSIDRGLPKTKTFQVPFRMEMSGFARLEGSLPIVGDLGAIWPVFASRLADALGLELGFVSYPQESTQGKRMREWIVENVRPVDRRRMLEGLRRLEGRAAPAAGAAPAAAAAASPARAGKGSRR